MISLIAVIRCDNDFSEKSLIFSILAASKIENTAVTASFRVLLSTLLSHDLKAASIVWLSLLISVAQTNCVPSTDQLKPLCCIKPLALLLTTIFSSRFSSIIPNTELSGMNFFILVEILR